MLGVEKKCLVLIKMTQDAVAAEIIFYNREWGFKELFSCRKSGLSDAERPKIATNKPILIII